MQSEVLNVINDLKLDMTASPVDDVTIITRAQLEALEAARSAAEPVDYQLVFSDGRTSRVLYSKDEAERFKKASDITVDIRPLYAAPPAPPALSVAVKALEWVENVAEAVTGDYWIVNATQKWLYRSPHVKIAPFDTVEAAKLAAQADYVARIRSALSAQVQDVAAATKAEVTDALDKAADLAEDPCACHSCGVVVPSSYAGQCCPFPNIHGATPQQIGAAIRALPAAPAKQEG